MSELTTTKRIIIKRMRDDGVRGSDLAKEAGVKIGDISNWKSGRLNGAKGEKIMKAAERCIARKIDFYRKIQNSIS